MNTDGFYAKSPGQHRGRLKRLYRLDLLINQMGILFISDGQIYNSHKRLAPAKQGEGIVSAFGNKRLCRTKLNSLFYIMIAMSAHHILELEKVPRVRLFAG